MLKLIHQEKLIMFIFFYYNNKKHQAKKQSLQILEKFPKLLYKIIFFN